MSNDRARMKVRLNGVFREVFDDETIEIFEEMTAKDIEGWDSLTHIVLVVAVEKEFKVTLNAAEVGALKNVGEMLDILEGRTKLASSLASP